MNIKSEKKSEMKATKKMYFFVISGISRSFMEGWEKNGIVGT